MEYGSKYVLKYSLRYTKSSSVVWMKSYRQADTETENGF